MQEHLLGLMTFLIDLIIPNGTSRSKGDKTKVALVNFSSKNNKSGSAYFSWPDFFNCQKLQGVRIGGTIFLHLPCVRQIVYNLSYQLKFEGENIHAVHCEFS
jgi:hypothetical protein